MAFLLGVAACPAQLPPPPANLRLSAPPPPSTNSPHYVFAHYMVCFATYGETIEAYQREIREAQAAGIDGFALNVGAWSGPDTYYKKRVGLLHDAAEQLGTDFRLFFSIDLTDTSDIVDMLRTYGPRPSSFRQQGRVVLSTFGQNNVDWVNSVFRPLKNEGIEVFFIPFFWPQPVKELPGYADAIGILGSRANILDGLFLFGAAGLPQQLADSNAAYCRAVREAGKCFMASYTPHYWGAAQPSSGRRYYEFQGGEGTELQWKSIITCQPDWVEIVTWNDFNESSYVCPVDDPGQCWAHLRSPRRHPHAGYLELSKRYVSWFKTGQEPPIDRDALFYFYRTHPKDAVARNTNEVPVTTRVGDVAEVLYLSTLLVDAAELETITGNRSTRHQLARGVQHVRVPFLPGPQRFVLRREDQTVFAVDGPEIRQDTELYNFFPASGFAYGPAGRPVPPSDVRIPGSQ
jgi:glucan endo-1,3-alpha-glucosidase